MIHLYDIAIDNKFKNFLSRKGKLKFIEGDEGDTDEILSKDETISNKIEAYSKSAPEDADAMTEMIIKTWQDFSTEKTLDFSIGKNPPTLTEICASTGNNTLSFAKYNFFSKITAYEINEVRFEKLAKRTKNFPIISVLNEAYDYKKVIDSEIAFFDVPWGGEKVYKLKNLIFGFGGVKKNNFIYEPSIGQLTKIILDNNERLKLVVHKLPIRYSEYDAQYWLSSKKYKHESMPIAKGTKLLIAMKYNE